MSTIVTNFIVFTAWYIGRTEKSKNSGFHDPKFEKELTAAGWYKGAPWCAFFIKMVFRKLFTGNLLQAVNAQFNGSAKQTFDNVKAGGVFETGLIPEPGAVCVCLLGHGPAGHEFMVEWVDFKSNTMGTIEGNTNASGSREGNCVARKLRTITRSFTPTGLNVYGYIYPRIKK
ncbi:hypothetical protein [Pedobacter ginsengisoli]|uniref:hypothetical protein n=1 Tax=Pedobacter ginsengisoli TaxID=363852 RepID=UPI00254B396B|nr:hypothetical protein [Pedobacter ginsengisoli]